MLKKLGVVVSSLLLVVGLAGCGSSKGDHYQAMGTVAKNGWTYYVSFEMKGTDITSFTFDAVQLKTQEGRTKQAMAAAGEYKLAPGNAGEFNVQAKLIEDYVVKNDGVKDITFAADGSSDAISGATIKYGEVSKLIEDAIAAGPVKKGKMTDGVYFGSVPAAAADKYSYQTAYFVNHGVILGVHLDGVINKDGKDVFKTDLAAEGKYVLAPNAVAPILDQLAAVEAFIVKTQGFDITLNAEGKTDAVSGATISLDGFQKAFTDAKLVK